MTATLQNHLLTVQAPKGVIPDLSENKREGLMAIARFFEALAGGMAPGQPGDSQMTIARGSTDAMFKDAFVTQAFASAVVTNTGVLNGATLTAIKQRATGTLTAASAQAGDTCVVGGITFTGVAGAPVLSTDFSIDTGDNETATSLTAAINAHASLTGIVTATAAAAVVTVRAVTSGTAGNSIVLTGTAVRLAASGSGTLAGGIAVANDQFDISPGGTDAQAATDYCRAINESTTTALMAVRACNLAGTIALASVLAGDYVEIGGIRFTAFPGTSPDRYDRFDMSGTNTADCTDLVARINAHPILSRLVLAVDGGSGTLTLRQKSGTTGLSLAASSSTFTLSGASLAASATALIVSQLPGLIGNAITSTSSANITTSAAKLSGGIGGNARTVYSYP